jgi:hypothetical protein
MDGDVVNQKNPENRLDTIYNTAILVDSIKSKSSRSSLISTYMVAAHMTNSRKDGADSSTSSNGTMRLQDSRNNSDLNCEPDPRKSVTSFIDDDTELISERRLRKKQRNRSRLVVITGENEGEDKIRRKEKNIHDSRKLKKLNMIARLGIDEYNKMNARALFLKKMDIDGAKFCPDTLFEALIKSKRLPELIMIESTMKNRIGEISAHIPSKYLQFYDKIGLVSDIISRLKETSSCFIGTQSDHPRNNAKANTTPAISPPIPYLDRERLDALLNTKDDVTQKIVDLIIGREKRRRDRIKLITLVRKIMISPDEISKMICNNHTDAAFGYAKKVSVAIKKLVDMYKKTQTVAIKSSELLTQLISVHNKNKKILMDKTNE